MLLDLETDIYIFNNRKWFINLQPLAIIVKSIDKSKRLPIKKGSNTKLTIINKFNILIPLTIIKAAFALLAKYNIISLSQLITKGKLTSK